MGISVLSSYRGGCNFETVGLSRTVVDDYFPGVLSKISGIGSHSLEIEGVSKLSGCNHNVMPDRIEAATYAIAAAITQGKVTLN